MYLLVVVRYFLIVFVKFEYKIYDVNVSDYIMLWNMVFELKFLVLD